MLQAREIRCEKNNFPCVKQKGVPGNGFPASVYSIAPFPHRKTGSLEEENMWKRQKQADAHRETPKRRGKRKTAEQYCVCRSFSRSKLSVLISGSEKMRNCKWMWEDCSSKEPKLLAICCRMQKNVLI